jgi:type VI secretion system protein ImpM
MGLFTLPAPGLDVPGWFGKLPGMGDFGQRRLPPPFLAIWDAWLQRGLQNLRLEREDWVAHYLHAPIWFFALGEDIMSASPWIGVLMPSVDSVGRYFPLTMAIELVHSNESSPEHQMAGIHEWWLRSAKAGLVALDANLDAASFDLILHSQFREPSGAHSPCLSLAGLPEARMSSWHINAGATPGVVETVAQLPDVAGFSVLFGYANPHAPHHSPQ